MKRRCKWNISEPVGSEAEILAEKLNILPTTAQLLINRGIGDESDAYDFINKRTDIFHDPFLLCDIDKAVSRLDEAVKKGEKITVYGDYDVDGITATSTIILYMRQYTDNIDYYIPSRSNEGYGVNAQAIKKLSDSGTKLIITVDTGITAIDEIALASDLGMDVIVTDHHQCRDILPNATAVVNPKRRDSKYPFSELAGVGVVFKLCCAFEIYKATGDLFSDKEKTNDIVSAVRRVCTKLCDLVSIGTIADVMPVTDENRLIVTAGLYLITKTRNTGLRALLKECFPANTKKPITAGSVSFILAPRINAMGRMSEAKDAVQMFLTDDEVFAESTAKALCVMNSERQQEENRICQEAEAILKSSPELADHKMLVLSGNDWHHGVVGIVASRLVEKYYVPTILISFEYDSDVGKGSGRSIPGFDLVKALSENADLLEKYGGHKAAAGLTVSKEKINDLASALVAYADEHITDECTVSLDVDLELSERDITEKFVNELSLLEPYGLGNPTPIFMMRNVNVLSVAPTASGTHTRLTLDIGGKMFSAMYFGITCKKLPFSSGGTADLLFNLSFNEYMGKRSVQLIIKDCKMSDELEDEYEACVELASDIIDDRIYPEARYIPNRSDIGAVYKHLKSVSEGKACDINTLQISDSLGFDVIKTILSYAVLDELSLISSAPSGRYSYEITVFNGKEKTQLDRSKLYLRLQSYGN